MRRAELRRAPHSTWGAFVKLLTSNAPESLTPPQRVAWYAFHYDAEVETAGHHGWFEREGLRQVDLTLAALAELGATSQRDVLVRAADLWLACSAGDPTRLWAGLDELDRAYHAVQPGIPELLQTWLDERLAEFIELVD